MSDPWVSISWAGLLLECSFPWDVQIEREEVGEPARYGSAFHELLAWLLRGHKLSPKIIARVADRYDVGKCQDELKTHVQASHAYFAQWLRGRNEFGESWGIETAHIEKAAALRPLIGARFIDPHDEHHKYKDLKPGELPGTLDYANTAGTLIVLDHKTGEEDFSMPTEKPQLLALAAAMMRITGREDCIVGVHHARRRGLPKVYAEKVTLDELFDFETKLKLALSRIGDGSLRPGTWCNRCPLNQSCRARDGQLLEQANDVLGGITHVGAQVLNGDEIVLPKGAGALAPALRDGRLYELAQMAEKLSKRIREELRRRLQENPNYLPETRSGEYLIIREYEKENISKSSIVEALGKVAGERELIRLRKLGAIKKTKITQLHLDKERGK